MSINTDKSELIIFNINSLCQAEEGCTKTEYTKGVYISKKSIIITWIDKSHLKCDFIDGSTVNGIRHYVSYTFALDEPPGQKIGMKSGTKLHKNKKTRFD